jgi:hypothetical protein
MTPPWKAEANSKARSAKVLEVETGFRGKPGLPQTSRFCSSGCRYHASDLVPAHFGGKVAFTAGCPTIQNIQHDDLIPFPRMYSV